VLGRSDESFAHAMSYMPRPAASTVNELRADGGSFECKFTRAAIDA
jgi:hypothetical protein